MGRLRELFDYASQIMDAAERAAFVAEECRENPQMKEDLLALLAADQEAHTWLDDLFEAVKAARDGKL